MNKPTFFVNTTRSNVSIWICCDSFWDWTLCWMFEWLLSWLLIRWQMKPMTWVHALLNIRNIKDAIHKTSRVICNHNITYKTLTVLINKNNPKSEFRALFMLIALLCLFSLPSLYIALSFSFPQWVQELDHIVCENELLS